MALAERLRGKNAHTGKRPVGGGKLENATNRLRFLCASKRGLENGKPYLGSPGGRCDETAARWGLEGEMKKESPGLIESRTGQRKQKRLAKNLGE